MSLRDSKKYNDIDPVIFEVWDGPSREPEEKNSEDDRDKFCFLGKTISIPIDKYLTEEQKVMEWNAVKDFVQEITKRVFMPLNHERKMEKYETFSVSSSEIIILYRVPCRPMTEGEMKSTILVMPDRGVN